MGALNPLFLLAGLAVGVPLFLHLFHRQEVRRVAFPALRYLERTEKEHARRIRLRQLLLLLLRVAAVLVLVGAGARLFLRGSGSSHPPTALALILDNSMSSGVVEGDQRALETLKAVAIRTLSQATENDRIWVIRAGEPWLPAIPGSPEEAMRVVEETTVSAGRGDLDAALARAAELVRTSDLEAREIHLVSDLQASAFPSRGRSPAGDLPVAVWAGGAPPVENRALAGVMVGGGLPPLEGQRSEIAIQAARFTDPDGDDADTVGVPVRVVLDERVRGAGILAPGSSLVLPLPAATGGWILGYADADPDALRADDRRYFAFQARPAPAVAVAGNVGVFTTEAVSVLSAGGRLRRSAPRDADAVLSGAGEAVDALGAGGAVLVVPPTDPTQLPALNRRLQQAGVPWRYERADAQGSVPLDGLGLPEALRQVQVAFAYGLQLTGDPAAPPHTLATAGGAPWAVEGRDTGGRRYLLLASPLDAASTTLPVSADMIQFVDWVATDWAASGRSAVVVEAGTPLSAPRSADAVRLPSGLELPVDGTRMVHRTGEAGIYAFLSGDSVVAYEAVNPASAESDLRRLASGRLTTAIGPQATALDDERAWGRGIFKARQGPELWRPLLLAALLILLVEAGVAATGRQARPRPRQGGEARPPSDPVEAGRVPS